MWRKKISLPDEIAEQVELQAQQQEMSVSAVIERLLLLGLRRQDDTPRALPFAGLFSDEGMVVAERLDQALAMGWADDIDRDRG